VALAFGEFEVDETVCELRASGRAVPVQPKVFDLLVYLIRNRNRVVPKNELLSALWPEVSVGETALTRAMNLARRAIRDNGHNQQAIQTVARRGYRFVGHITEIEPPSSLVPELEAPQEGATLPQVAVFVGRDGVMTRLEADLRQTLSGHGRCAVIGGEPGIGKTRTAEEFARRARSFGAEVLCGFCYEGQVTPPYWPWIQVLRAHCQQVGVEEVRSQCGADAELATLLPELRDTGGSVFADVPAEQGRFQLFESIVAVLKGAATQRALVVILDDIHWADPSSLRVLEFVSREIRQSSILFVVTYRDTGLAETHPLRHTLATLARYGIASRITLQGLTRQEVGDLIHAVAGIEPATALVDGLYDRTAGNPFFVHEVVFALAADGQLEEAASTPDLQIAVPPGVRDVISQRLQALSPACQEILKIAAVIGPEFELRALLRATSGEEEGTISLLEEATRFRILQEQRRHRGSYRFCHALVQEALYNDQSIGRRTLHHRRIGEALAEIYGTDADTHAAALSHHFCRGAQPGATDRAIAFATEAGRRAMRVLAYEEAVRHYERAIETIELNDPPDASPRAQLLIELGRALSRAGFNDRAEAVVREAASIARAIRAPEMLAQAALALAGDAPTVVGHSMLATDLLWEASSEINSESDPVRLKVLCRLCAQLGASGLVERAATIGDQAIKLATQLADPALRVLALNARASVYVEEEAPSDRCRRAEEAIRFATAGELYEAARESHLHLAAGLLEAGDLPAFDRAMEIYSGDSELGLRPLSRWYSMLSQTMRLILVGKFDEAEERTTAAFQLGRRLRHPDAALYLGIQLTQIRYLQGRLSEMQDSALKLMAENPSVPGLRALAALIASQSGELEVARRELQRFADRGFEELPRDAGRLSNLSLWALVSIALADVATSERLHSLLQPFRGRNVCAFVVASNGAVDYYLGASALVAGRTHEGIRHLESALRFNKKMNALPWVAHTQLALARSLVRAGQPRKAKELARAALQAGQELGMKQIVCQAPQVLTSGPSI
jgi:DNA-binding winged helix-turn-helix (wHTH) protein/tetratricopeptide (TPR) repeat protein